MMNWIHLENPSMEKIQQLSNEYHFPIDYLVSTLDPDEVSRKEHLNKDQPGLILLLAPYKDEKNYNTRTISIVLLKESVITCTLKNPDFMEGILDKTGDLIPNIETIEDLVVELLWQITSGFVLAGKEINTQLDYLYKQSIKSTKSELLYQLADLDKSVLYVSSAIEDNHPIIDSLSQTDFLKEYKEELHDILVENHQAKRMSDKTRRVLTQLDTTFSSIIQNNLNEIMKILTSLTIIITIPSIIGSIWGMNVGLPFMNHPLAFVIIVALIFILMIVSIYWLRKKDLL